MNDKMAIFIFSVNVINRLLLSFLVLTKVITLSGVHYTFKKCEGGENETVKNDGSGRTVLAFTITEISYFLESLLYDLVRSLFLSILVVLRTLAALFALFLA